MSPRRMSPRRKPKGEILTPIPEEDSNLSTTSEAENKSKKKEKINENIRRRRLGRALMATEVHCKTRMAMIVWRVCKAYTSSTSSSSDHTRTSDLSSILRTWCSSAKRENISFLLHLLRGLTRVTYTTNKSHSCHSIVSSLATVPLECYGNT